MADHNSPAPLAIAGRGTIARMGACWRRASSNFYNPLSSRPQPPSETEATRNRRHGGRRRHRRRRARNEAGSPDANQCELVRSTPFVPISTSDTRRGCDAIVPAAPHAPALALGGAPVCGG